MGGSDYSYIRMRTLKGGDACRGCNQTDKDKAVTAFFIHTISSYNDRAAGRQHRVRHDYLPTLLYERLMVKS